MKDTEIPQSDDFQPVTNTEDLKGAPPALWGAALSLVTLLFLAIMLAL